MTLISRSQRHEKGHLEGIRLSHLPLEETLAIDEVNRQVRLHLTPQYTDRQQQQQQQQQQQHQQQPK